MEIIKDKRGVLGLSTVKGVMIWFLILVVLAIAILLALSSIRDVSEDIDKSTVVVVNESVTSITIDAQNLAYALDNGYRNAVCTVSQVANATDGEVLIADNYTTSNNGCSIALTTAGGDGPYNDTNIHVDYSATYSNPTTNFITTNVSSALSNNFFNQTGTIFAILIVVVIILAISIIIAVVTRFGAGGSIGSSGGSYGSDTLMGV
jgi:uncharacterized membrane protein